jgi:hypothetical protein
MNAFCYANVATGVERFLPQRANRPAGRRWLLLVFAWAASAAGVQAQTLNPAGSAAGSSFLPAPTPYATVSRDANSAVWQQQTYGQGPKGTIVTNLHQYVELATGLNFKNPQTGQWQPSSESIFIAPDGSSASATNGQHQVYFPGNIYSGVIRLVTPDGQTLESQPIGLSYSDGSNSVLLAVATNSTGAILSSGNQVIYTNAFTGLNADLVYTYTRAGMEQDVILREQPPDPASTGLNSVSTRLQMLTEFIVSPQPTVSATTVPTDAGNLEDDSLSIGTMAMGQGKAFLIGSNSSSVDVEKRWLAINGRQFLIEEIPLVSIAAAIDSLPPYVTQTSTAMKPVASKNLILPLQRITHTSPKASFLAKAMPSCRGLVLDYITMISQTNWVFHGDTTYFLSGPVSLWGTNNVIEGGAVLKYTNNAGLYVNRQSTTPAVQFQTSAYRPAIFTAWNDDSVGDTISGSTGNPTNYCANPALSLTAPSFTPTIANFRIAYAQQAISLAGTSPTIADGQIVNCQNGIFVNGAGGSLENVLFANVVNDFSYSGGGALTVQNATFSGSSYLEASGASLGLAFTNCIFANVTNLYSGSPSGFGGDHNGFYQTQPFGTATNGSSVFPFQSVGAGNYYLTNGCNFFNAGSTNIDLALLTGLQQRTAYPPILLSNFTVSANTTLSPQAQRDTDSPDLGYHYDAIDYLIDGFWVTNAALTVTNGAVVACYNDSGIMLTDGSSINSMGSPQAPNWFVRYSSAQEQPLSLGPNGNPPSSGTAVNPWHLSMAPSGQFRFTIFACPAGGGNHLYDTQFNWAYSNLWVQDCEFYGGQNTFDGDTNSVVTLRNNLFDRSRFSAVGSASNSLSLTNNLFWGVGLTGNPSRIKLSPASGSVWYAFNNAFDTSVFNPVDSCTNGFNAYLNCTNYVSPTNSTDMFLTNALAYQAGPFGTFYQPTNSPLIHMGNTNANLIGLYHYTVTTNEVVEGTNIVSVGYHYVATDPNGNPLSTPGDGIPDYVADANGNGLVDNGENSWTNYNSINGLINGSGLVVFTPLK